MNELPGDIASRLRVKMCDMNENALEWARSNLRNDPLGHNVSVIRGMQGRSSFPKDGIGLT